MNKKVFKSRQFLSIGTFLFFIILTISGVALHKMNHHTDFTFMLVFCKTLHTISAAAFMVFAALHTRKNWKSIKSYMSGVAKMSVSREMWIAILLTIFTVLISIVKAVGTANEHGISF